MPKQNDPYEALRLTDEQLATLSADDYEDFPPDDGDEYEDYYWWDDSYDCGCCMCCGCSCDDDDLDMHTGE